MKRGTRACIATSALALIVMTTGCGRDEPVSAAAPAPDTAPTASQTAMPGLGSTKVASTRSASTPSDPAPSNPAPSDTAPPPATAPGDRTTATEAVASIRERARRLWDAKVHADWATVYALSDAVIRDEGTEEEFVAWSNESEPFKIEAYDLGEVLVEGTMAWVQVNARMSTRQFESPAREVERWDKWRFTEGDGWYPVPKRLLEAYPLTPALRDREAEARLRARFMASWEARHTRDWKTYLDLYSPQDREIMTLDEFIKVNEMFTYEACDVRWVEVVNGRGRVRVAITERVTDPSLSKLPPQVVILTEKWTNVDGEWYIDLGLTESSRKPETSSPRGEQ